VAAKMVMERLMYGRQCSHIAAKTTRNGETPLQIAKDSGHDATVYALFHQDVLVSDICMANTNTVDESRLERIDT
jgi:hypothetical protein